jgi:hypothetical protein
MVRTHVVIRTAVVSMGLLCGAIANTRATPVFSTDFESGVPAQLSAPGSVIAGVQGYAGLGPTGRQFSGSFLRYTSVPLHDTQLSLTGLPAHDRLSVKFLLAVIDSWDGAELMQVLVDGNLVFSNWFQLAVGDASSYVAPPGGLLSSGTDLGFSSYYAVHDRAYDLGVEPALIDIPHSASTADIVWRISAISGPAANQWQGGDDESWAIDQISVDVSSTTAVGAGGMLAFRLDSPSPNPARRGHFTVSFDLASEAQGSLALIDVTGRRLASREVGTLGAGSHVVDLASGHSLTPGVYFVELRQGTQSAVRRAVVVD